MVQFFLFIVACIIAFLCYGLIYLTIKFIYNLLGIQSKNATNKQKFLLSFISICTSVIISYFCFLKTNNHNYKHAYIEKFRKSYLVTVFREEGYMAHDLISLLQRSTYKDSIRLELPFYRGVIIDSSVNALGSNIKFIKGEIQLNENTMSVNLFYLSPYSKLIEPFTYNGKYDLEWTK